MNLKEILSKKSASKITQDDLDLVKKKLHVEQDIDLDEFRRGISVELEHGLVTPYLDITGNQFVLTSKIALAHLLEDPMYYQKLAKIEKH